jgi:uncharacterized protein (UPF0548 family)
MFNNVALDVAIGLIFIFLLYSLLSTIIMEFIAHYMGMRARMLLKALRRMLEDNPKEIFGIKKKWTLIDSIADFKESIKRFFYPLRDLPFLDRFYRHPTIKYLGESKSKSKPSYMQPGNFSQTILQMLRGNNYDLSVNQIAAIENFLFVKAPAILNLYEKEKHWILNDRKLRKLINKEYSLDTIKSKLENYAKDPIKYKATKKLIQDLIKDISDMGSVEKVKKKMEELTPFTSKMLLKISPETLKHFQNLFYDAEYNLERFKQQLEAWFNSTMERASGWYKRQTQIVLLCLGFVIAIWGNVDTIKIYKILAKDKKTREQLVTMAIQSQEKYASAIDTIRNQKAKKDTVIKSSSGTDSITIKNTLITTGDSVLDQTYKMLQSDIEQSTNILGVGWCSSDSCKAYKNLERKRDTLKAALSDLADKHKEQQLALQKQIDPLAEGADRNSKQKYLDSLKKSQDGLETVLKNQVKKMSADVKSGYRKFKDKWNGLSLLGWLITALAISLGAPFWFDILNKFVKMRSASAPSASSASESQNIAAASSQQPVNVNVNTQSGEEAVG